MRPTQTGTRTAMFKSSDRTINFFIKLHLPNVLDDLAILASGIRAFSEGDMPEVPKA
jgi:hypothetical protein